MICRSVCFVCVDVRRNSGELANLGGFYCPKGGLFPAIWLVWWFVFVFWLFSVAICWFLVLVFCVVCGSFGDLRDCEVLWLV